MTAYIPVRKHWMARNQSVIEEEALRDDNQIIVMFLVKTLDPLRRKTKLFSQRN